MDWQRTILIAALAVVSYMMILQWQKDYVETPQAQQTQNYPQSYTQNDGTSDVPADVPVASAPAGGDVPVDPSAEAAQPATATLKPTKGLITVDTDVLQVSINPVGGDIVHVGLKDYPVSLDKPDVPFSLLDSNSAFTYISQSGLIGPDGPDGSKSGRPHYASDQTHYQMQGDTLVVKLNFRQESGTLITKTFTFKAGQHVIDVNMQVDNQSNQTWQGLLYGQIKRDGSADPGVNKSVGFGLPTYLGGAYWDQDKTYNKIKFDDMEESPLNKKIPGGWLAMIQHYFISAWIPDQSQTYHYTTRVANGDYILGFTSPKVSVEPGTSHNFEAQFYAGPKIQEDLKALVPGKGLDLAIDFGPLFFISEFLFWLLATFHGLIGNWGFSIILLTLVVKAVFFYPSALSYKSMAKMRKVAPEMTRLREQYGDDRQKLSQEMMSLYKKEKINPLGGCLPILIQMPVFLALYWALLESVELRQAPFLFWIKDLAAMDPYFVLPLIMGGSMVVQQMLNPAPPDPMQAKVMKFMPFLFTIMFLWFPAGLVLYWVTNNTLSITQQYIITRRIESGAIK